MAKLTDVGGRPHSGIVHQTVTGIVTDNVDPKEQGRVKVKYPTMNGEPESDWIWQASPMSGKSMGFYSLPEKEDTVLVSFMQGNQDNAVILGHMWNGVDTPPPEAKDGLPGPDKTDTGGEWSKDKFTEGSKSLEKNDRRFWRSRSGHLFVFDDTSGAESIQMWDKDHTLAFVFDTKEKRILLTNTNGDIHIRCKNDLYFEAGNDIKWRAGNNIDGESGKDTTHHAGQNWKTDTGQEASHKTGADFKIEATGNLTATANQSATIEGKMDFGAKGGMTAKLEAGGVTEVKGGQVRIN